MYKLIFTLLTLTTSPGAPPSATTSTAAVDFRAPEACEGTLAAARRQGERVVAIRGATVTVRLLGGHCVPDGVAVMGEPLPGIQDLFGLMR